MWGCVSPLGGPKNLFGLQVVTIYTFLFIFLLFILSNIGVEGRNCLCSPTYFYFTVFINQLHIYGKYAYFGEDISPIWKTIY